MGRFQGNRDKRERRVPPMRFPTEGTVILSPFLCNISSEADRGQDRLAGCLIVPRFAVKRLFTDGRTGRLAGAWQEIQSLASRSALFLQPPTLGFAHILLPIFLSVSYAFIDFCVVRGE